MAQITTSEPPTLGNRQRAVGMPAAGSINGSISAGADGDAETVPETQAGGLTEGQWLQRAQLVQRAATQWFDSSVRQGVQRNYAHFKGRHAASTKYASANYTRHRSSLFRPKTRSMMRRTEAAAAVAFFSTADLLSVSAFDDSDIDQRDAATVAQAVMQYRLEDTRMRWFQTVVGAVQDAGVSGVCISRQEWMYRTSGYKAVSEAGGLTDEEDVLEDRPAVTLRPVENFRFDPGCDWRDPINTSPYLIDKDQRYACDIDSDARRINKATGEKIYTELTAREWMMAARKDYDSIRTERGGQHVDKYDAETGIPDYNVIVTYRHIMRVDDVDWYFETLDDLMLLCLPKPLEEVYPHLLPGERPYAMGSLTLETHNPMPDSPVAIIAAIQEETNELANIRIDTNRMALMSRWAVRRGANVDVPTLMSSIPGSGIVMDNIQTDLKELKTSDVGQAAFAQEDRLNLDIDEASGNFSLASIASNRQLGETVGGMNLLSGDATQVKEYELRTFSETWVEPVLNQLYQLESAYETDRALLQQVVASSRLPIERVLEVMALRVRVRVNVGFNATSPEKRIGKLTTAAAALNQLFPEWLQQKANKSEFAKEIFGALGYKNSDRFIPDDSQDEADPEKKQLQEQVAQLQSMLQGKVLENQSREKIAQMNNETRRYLGELTTRIEVGRLRLEQMDRMLAAEAVDTDRKQLTLEREALSHQVQMDTTRLIASLSGMNEQTPEGSELGGNGMPSKPSSGAPPMSGDDRAGVISRDRYGDVPFQQG
jgi:hypothetical protein